LRDALSWVPFLKPRDARPPSLPRGWPNNMTADDLAERPNRIIKLNEEQDYLFEDNFVKTSVYEWYTFLPLFLAYEFNPLHKIANVYFLFIAAAQVSNNRFLCSCTIICQLHSQL
jgi:Phospholipid-translocating ATPase N-terminal